MAPSASPAPSSAKALPVAEAYDQWAPIYDKDNNFLQALDDHEMTTLLPQFLSSLSSSPSSDSNSNKGQQLLVDLGCDTGRNTLRLLQQAPAVRIIGLELSPKMLDIARSKTENLFLDKNKTATITSSLEFYQYDMLNPSSTIPSTSLSAGQVDAIISTLVLEHVPLPTFFHTASSMLKVGGKLLVTNMHPDMGAISQAGFVDPGSGVKIQTDSFVHGIDETVAAAREVGLRGLGEVREMAVDEEIVGSLGPRGGKWVGVHCWFGVVFEKVG